MADHDGNKPSLRAKTPKLRLSPLFPFALEPTYNKLTRATLLQKEILSKSTHSTSSLSTRPVEQASIYIYPKPFSSALSIMQFTDMESTPEMDRLMFDFDLDSDSDSGAMMDPVGDLFEAFINPDRLEMDQNLPNSEIDDLQLSREINSYTYIDANHPNIIPPYQDTLYTPTDSSVSSSLEHSPIYTPQSSPTGLSFEDYSPQGGYSPPGEFFPPNNHFYPGTPSSFVSSSPIVNSPPPYNSSSSSSSSSSIDSLDTEGITYNTSSSYTLFDAVDKMMSNIDPALEDEVNKQIPFSPLQLSFELSEAATTSTNLETLAAPAVPALSPLSPHQSPTPTFSAIYPIANSPPLSYLPVGSPLSIPKASPLSTSGASPSSTGSPQAPASLSNGRGKIVPPTRKRRPSNSSGIVKKYKCDFRGCVKVCDRPCDLKKHKKRHEKPFMCRYDDCDSCGFSTEKDRERHEKSKHKKNEHLVCIYCGHSTARKDNMKDHVRRRHGAHDLKESMDDIMKTEGVGYALPSDEE